MGFVRSIKALFTGLDVPPHEYVPSTLTFDELNIPLLVKKLRLAEEGRERGTREQPPTDQNGFDAIEARIATTIRSELNISHERFLRHMRAYGERQAALKVSGHMAQLVTQADSATSDFVTHVANGRDLIWRLANDLEASQEELRRFQEHHQLDRPPRFPPSHTLHWGAIAVLVVVESLLNGALLARGNELGELGGTTQALAIALLNVGLGLAAGKFIAPNLWHRSAARKVVGGIGMGLWGCAAFVFNLGVAHYRAALAINPPAAEKLALEGLASTPLQLGEISGWFLFLLGCSFSAISAFDGWKMDDPYPGYGSIVRRRDNSLDEYTEQKQELLSDLQDVRNASVAKIDELILEVERGAEQYKNIQRHRAHMIQHFNAHLRYLQLCGNELLSAYRQSNRESRTTPVPNHFSSEWELTETVESVNEASTAEPTLDEKVAKTFEEIKAARQRIEQEYQGTVREFQSVESLVKGGKQDAAFRASPARG